MTKLIDFPESNNGSGMYTGNSSIGNLSPSRAMNYLHTTTDYIREVTPNIGGGGQPPTFEGKIIQFPLQDTNIEVETEDPNLRAFNNLKDLIMTNGGRIQISMNNIEVPSILRYKDTQLSDITIEFSFGQPLSEQTKNERIKTFYINKLWLPTSGDPRHLAEDNTDKESIQVRFSMNGVEGSFRMAAGGLSMYDISDENLRAIYAGIGIETPIEVERFCIESYPPEINTRHHMVKQMMYAGSIVAGVLGLFPKVTVQGEKGNFATWISKLLNAVGRSDLQLAFTDVQTEKISADGAKFLGIYNGEIRVLNEVDLATFKATDGFTQPDTVETLIFGADQTVNVPVFGDIITQIQSALQALQEN